VRWLGFAVGLVAVLLIHSFLDTFLPGALGFLDPYLVLVVYFASGGNLVGTIAAGVVTGLVQDAFSLSIFGLHAFSLTLSGYLVALLNNKIVLRGAGAFAACVAGAILLNEATIAVLNNLLVSETVTLFDRRLVLRILLTSGAGAVVHQALHTLQARRVRTEGPVRRRW